LLGTIEGRNDIMGGRKSDDRRTAKTNTWGKCFSSICYSADGSCLLAGGNSKYICLYELSQRVLLRKFQTSWNKSLDGVLDYLNSKNMTEAGPLDLLDLDREDRFRDTLPGVQKGDLSKRRTKPAIQ
jgi:periodic tryptophan protein 2